MNRVFLCQKYLHCFLFAIVFLFVPHASSGQEQKVVRELAVNATDEEFSSKISSFIDIENFIDYYLLLNLTSAGDNTGKNMFFYKENSKKLYRKLDGRPAQFFG